MNSLAKRDELASDIGETTEVSWHGSDNMTYDEWAAVGRTLQQIGRSLHWWLGDWLNHGEHKWGEMYTQALEITGLSVETLSKYKRVSARIAPEIRRPELTWTHHFTVAYTEEDLRGPMLEMAANFSITSRDLKEIMRLDASQQRSLIHNYEGGAYEKVGDLHRQVHDLRLTDNDPKGQGQIVNGKALPMRSYDVEVAASDDEDDFEDAGYEAGEVDLDAEEEEVFIEEVMDFFDAKTAKMERCTQSEAVWDGLAVVADVDKKGKPFLRWMRPGGG